MKQYQDERTLQVRNRIYAELMRIMLCVVVLSFCIKTLYFHMDLAQCMTEYILMILAPVYQAVRIRQTEVVLDRAGQPQARHSPAAFAAADSVFPAQKRNCKREFFFPAAPCDLCASVPCDTVSFFPCGGKTGRKTGKRYDAEDETK